ncbi:protein translocase subunit SecF [bacterium (Candidatus Gribaldobacteria) CG02_land_8_20_14_3_00_41_15]|uniref:Protein-export membrane protein SecF n=2 Tax=Candidatus Gribaldobacteria TaxID=2798536 RepID=A0A2H0UXH3_9BACT|nr:MAG: protein translocase subunit SecF [bacterium (Candidatus Gribaldobacteria) CG10_big_fil_rev_8_21_14_0_10_41_12]PIV47431.1 MAG: protein translocase subunit SecF [bacterium (Candidatus Gribaldobacteria) CG02_land_8_20_14_3_00_41_15]
MPLRTPGGKNLSAFGFNHMLSFTKHRKIFYTASIILTVASLVSMAIFGLKFGIEFTGGSVLEVGYKQQAPALEDIQKVVIAAGLEGTSVQVAGDQRVIIKTKPIDESKKNEVMQGLLSLGQIVAGSESFQVIGPVIGQELKNKTKVVVFLSLLSILIYIAISFRKISRPVKSYIYGFTGIVALCHDIIIPLGVFAWLGHYLGVEITIPIITALLTVFGYSINDSVVVFDRIRENLFKGQAENFSQIVDQSLNQTLGRSVNTSFTVLLVLAAILFFGGATLRYFALALFLGVGFGTYSSIFIASLLVVTIFETRQNRGLLKNKK